MSRRNAAAPVIIKRKKVSGGAAHHGGAWKVAYADFVTAMMAFFLMMWLLGATTETQRRGLADYFNPSVPVHRMASGGDGMFAGTETDEGEGVAPGRSGLAPAVAGDPAELDPAALMQEAQQRMRALAGENPVLDEALRHLLLRVTDEGLVLELFDLPDSPLFSPDTSDPAPVLLVLSDILGEVLGMVGNGIAIEAHTRSYTLVQRDDPHWSLSMTRAAVMRRLIEERGVDPARLRRVTGHADRRPAVENAMSSRNNRLEIILLHHEASR